MAAAAEMTNPVIVADYDRAADVLYISRGNPRPDEGEDFVRGIILRFAMDNSQPSGATVVGFVHNRWRSDIGGLANKLSKHLRAPAPEIEKAIRKALWEAG